MMQRIACVFIVAMIAFPAAVRAELPLEIRKLERSDLVDFDREIMPLLKRNCLACHHAKDAEGGLVLVTLASIVAGGDSGTAVVANDAAASGLLIRASGAEEPLMPPEDNEVGAVPFTPDELGLLKLWIDQGALASHVDAGDAMKRDAIAWQAIPESLRTVYAMDVSPDGQLAAIGRGNRIDVVDLATQSGVAKLVDASIGAGDVADLDLIQSLAFSPDGERIASGGFRTVRIWHRVRNAAASVAAIAGAHGMMTLNPDGSRAAIVNSIGDIELRDVATNQLQKRFTGQSGLVTGLAWTVQPQRIVVAQRTGRLRVFDPESGEIVATHETLTTLRDMRVASDASLIVTLAADSDATGKVQIYQSTADGESTKLTRLHDSLAGITDAVAICIVDQPQPLAVIAKATGGVVIVDILNNTEVRSVEHGGTVESLAISPDSTTLATGGRDGKTRLWNIADVAAIITAQGTPDERLALARAQRDSSRQTNLLTQLTARTTELAESLKIETEALAKVTTARDTAKSTLDAENQKHADAAALVAATQAIIDQAKRDTSEASQMLPAANKTVELANANVESLSEEIKSLELTLTQRKESLEKFTSMVAKSQAEIEQANLVAEQAKVAIDKATAEFETQTKAAAAALETKTASEKELRSRQQALDATAAAVDLATQAIPTHQAILDAETRRGAVVAAELVTVQSLASEPEDSVQAIAFHASSDRIATVHRDGSTRVYRVGDGLPVHQFASSQHADTRVAFVGDDVCRFGALQTATLDSLATSWSLERTIGGVDDPMFADRVTALQFRRDSRSLAVGGGEPSRAGNVKIFAVDSGEVLRDFGDIHSDTVLALDFTPDGNLLATASADRTIQLLDVVTGETRRTLEGHTHHVLAIDWHNDGQTLASASADQTVKLWNTATGEATRSITGFPKELTALAFVPAANQIVIACASGQVRLSDTTNGNAVRNYDAGGDFLYTVSLNHDATRILAGGQSGTVRVWNLADAAVVSELK